LFDRRQEAEEISRRVHRKALWLHYPDAVPMFDSFAQRAPRS